MADDNSKKDADLAAELDRLEAAARSAGVEDKQTRLILTDTEREAAFLNGPTLFSNRYTVQTYPDGAVRLVFAEQYSSNSDIPPVLRSAVYLTQSDAVGLLRMLYRAITPESEDETASKEG